MGFGELAFSVGRRIGKHPLSGRLFCLTERWLPVDKIAREDGLVAFHHPRPIAVPHVLIVPTRPFSSLTTDRLSEAEKSQIVWSMVQFARQVSEELPVSNEWQLVINDGTRQDIGQVHGHLLQAPQNQGEAENSLTDPAIQPGTWSEIFTVLRVAERVPNSGYSLEVRWNSHGEAHARITQSH